jgi:uncharacterized protein (TIGR02270 family)
VVADVLRQHAEDAAILLAARSNLIRAPHVRIRHLRRFDDRLEAHLDGLRIAGEDAWSVSQAALERPSPGAVFAVTVQAIECQRWDRLETIFALLGAECEARTGLFSALGWLKPERLRGVVAELLSSKDQLKRLTGVVACAMHRVDPGINSARRFEDPACAVRARVWRTAGELGKNELISSAAAAMADEDTSCQFWAAWSAVLMGHKRSALGRLTEFGSTPNPFRARALQLAIQAMNVEGARSLLAQDSAGARTRIRGAGIAGDPGYIPWLIGLMADDARARLAGESFSLITGLDLAWLDLDRKPPENFESGPNDDPNDPNVDMDEDDGLPWPDQAKIQSWWQANSHRFQSGVRYFMGEPLNPANCLRVLKDGFQRQRILAAHYLCLLNPGTVLFNTSAPAWRQQRSLSQMS